MKITRVKSTVPLVEQVCSRLTRLLRAADGAGDGRMLPPERTMAQRFGVSRTVLREATKRLELQGLLEIRHGSGARAVDRLQKPLNGSLSLLLPEISERLRQLIVARAAIEPVVATLAAARARPADVRRLQRLQLRLCAAATHEESVDADIEFHRELARIAGNDILKLILESLADLSRESRRVTIGKVGKKRAIEHHAAILRAVATHDAAAAERAMKHHMEEAALDLAPKAMAKK